MYKKPPLTPPPTPGAQEVSVPRCARKYGLRISLSRAVPGSQNGWNHLGRLGTIGFLNGPMGYANAHCTLNRICILTEFISALIIQRCCAYIFGILDVSEPVGTVGRFFGICF